MGDSAVSGSAPQPPREPERAPEGFIATNLTPSGIEVEYRAEPKRQYRIRQLKIDQEFETEGVNWQVVPSVTDVLDVLKKDGLHWWGMTVGVENLMKLMSMGLLSVGVSDGYQNVVLVNTPLGWTAASVDQVVELLKRQRLTVNDVRDKAGDRGQHAHDVLELWANGMAVEDLPKPSEFAPSEQGYIAGVHAFLSHVPSAVPTASEVMVGSLQHGFAGRYDVEFRTSEAHNIVVHRTPVRGPQWATLAAGYYLGDLKTTKRIYTSHGRQLEGYEGARLECGYEPTDGRGVLLVQPDGTYVFKRSKATFQMFLNTLAVYRDEKAL